ncbi:hypothetical protein [Mucilaginibacter sp. 3215]|uniref:hypothetical protein n=1 Tax=Mucilaginibacter sp. 3215 TaxID=3373912 RepID=UPI003D206629
MNERNEDINLLPIEAKAALKLKSTIESASKKDYYDLFELLNVFTFAELIRFFENTYPNISLISVLKSLSNFREVELEDTSTSLSVDWDKIKHRFAKEIKDYVNMLCAERSKQKLRLI